MSLLGGTLSILDLVSQTEFLIPFPFLSQVCSSQTPLNPMVAPGKYLESLLTWRNSDWCFLPIYLACNLFCQLECYSMFLSIILSASFPVSILSLFSQLYSRVICLKSKLGYLIPWHRILQ